MLKLLVTLQLLAATARDRFTDREQGATAVEYALMVALIAGVIIGAVTLLGHKVTNTFNNVANSIP